MRAGFVEALLGVVAAADEGAGGDVGEADVQSGAAEGVELLGAVEARDGGVVAAGAEVLTDGEHFDAGVAEVVEQGEDFVVGFAQAEHKAALDEGALGACGHGGQDSQRPVVVGGAADLGGEAAGGFDVVVEHVGSGGADDVEGVEAALEVGGEDFDSGGGQAVAEGMDGAGEVPGAAIGEVVAGDGGDHDVAEAEVGGGLGDAEGFVGFNVIGVAVGDAAEATVSGADAPEDQEGGRAAGEALAAVGAGGVGADGMQAQGAEQGIDASKGGAVADRPFEPVGQAGGGLGRCHGGHYRPVRRDRPEFGRALRVSAGAAIIGGMDRATLRLLDANFNRAREAVRVLEDTARFVLNDAGLSGSAKELRHELSLALGALGSGALLGSRDTPGDVGTALSTASERQRPDAPAVAAAAGKRLSEALRCLEEYGKLAAPEEAARIKQLRYKGYELEKQIVGRVERGARVRGLRLYVIVTAAACRRGLLEAARGALAGGADCLQLREKGRSDGELLALASQVRDLCREAGTLFVMNDRADVAVAAAADGVHVGQQDLPVGAVRRVVGGCVFVGKSTHSPAEVDATAAEGPDYLAVGSVFGSGTKPDAAVCGLELVRYARERYGGAILAIGGVTAENAAEALAAGATGVAVCQAVCGAEDPAAAAAALKETLAEQPDGDGPSRQRPRH